MAQSSSDQNIGVKAGGYDDAIHLPHPMYADRTLCDQDATTRNVKRPWEPFREDGSECWSCALRREQKQRA